MLNIRSILPLLMGLLIFSSLQCSKMAPNVPQVVETSAVSASVQMAEKNYAAAALDSLILQVSGPEITNIRRKLMVDGTQAHDQLQVPAGKEVKVEVTGYQDSTAVLYGSQILTAEKDKVAPVNIMLDFMVPTIILSPPDSVLQKGQHIEVFLAARNVLEMATFGTEVHFDPTKLRVVELGREDDFLTLNRGSVMQLDFTKDNDAGIVKAVLGVFPASSAVSGSGNVGRITFEALETDTTDITLRIDNSVHSDLGLFDKAANLMYSVGLGSRIYIQADQPL